MQGYDYSQNDSRWKDEPLGFSGFFHLGAWQGRHDVAAGCAVTDFAMMASYLGHVCNPSQMNAMMKEHGLINANGDFTVNDVLSRLFPDIEFIERVDWPHDPAPLRYFNILNDTAVEIMVLIDCSPADGLQQHWLRVRGWDGKNDILVVDPWDGSRKGLSAYAARDGKSVDRIIYAAIKYRRRPTPIPSTPAPAPAQPAPPAPPTPTSTPVPSPSVRETNPQPATEVSNPQAIPGSTTPPIEAQPVPQSPSGDGISSSANGADGTAAPVPGTTAPAADPNISPDTAKFAIWRYLVRFLVQVARRFL